MKVASTVSPDFVEGFVNQCMDYGMTLDETEELLHKHCNNAVFTRPDTYEGFREKVANFRGDRAKLARFLTPDVIALAEDMRIQYGDDPMSMQVREELGLPEPSWDTVPDDLKKVASNISRLIDEYDYMPLAQKLLLASIVGGTAGGIGRVANPSQEDMALGRGGINRFVRGGFQGGATGFGGVAGADIGSQAARGISPPGSDYRGGGMLLGGTGGAFAANQLAKRMIH